MEQKDADGETRAGSAGNDRKIHQGDSMNKLEQDTLEIIQEFLPRIAVALEKIANQQTQKGTENANPSN